MNSAPGVVQSSVCIPWVGATGPETPPLPPPLLGELGTAVGGLALAAPLWAWAAGVAEEAQQREQRDIHSTHSTSIRGVRGVGGGVGASTQRKSKAAKLAESGIPSPLPRLQTCHIAVLGGGGCALPATLSSALGSTVVAIEPEDEVCMPYAVCRLPYYTL
jgi:hypothetical protein